MKEESVLKFKELYKKVFEEELSDSEASRHATRILNLYIAIYGERLGLTTKNSATKVEA